VMDYPAPEVGITDGHLDLSHAYARGIGAFDKFSVAYAYSQFPPGADEARELQQIVARGVAAGMLFISDDDSRPAGAAHPLSSLWDNGADPVATLRHEMEVRRIGLSQFGLASIADGTPLSMLEAKLLPLYLHHRYQLLAAVKTLGGLSYTYSVKTDAGPMPTPVAAAVPGDRQRDALRAVLDTITMDALAIPGRILDLIPPRAFGYGGRPVELFEKRTDPVFDPVGAATIAADLAVTALLEPERAARLDQFHARRESDPDFDEVVRALLRQTWYYPAAERPRDGLAPAVMAAVQDLVVTRLMDLASNAGAATAVRAVALGRLRNLRDNIRSRSAGTLVVGAGMSADHLNAAAENIDHFLTRPDAPYKRSVPLAIPPGDPIGGRIR
jgi:Met-zincin